MFQLLNDFPLLTSTAQKGTGSWIDPGGTTRCLIQKQLNKEMWRFYIKQAVKCWSEILNSAPHLPQGLMRHRVGWVER